jgi:hypothetical protein
MAKKPEPPKPTTWTIYKIVDAHFGLNPRPPAFLHSVRARDIAEDTASWRC